ncbi:class IV adenylate cyclase [Nocardia sp. BMG111209]|uniref:class IV adenylate cyclase n=1 Tax=Nocardia sp. BMG111209 TaxID=1160137 RepID=UPI0012DCA87E|nr:class IV adenylate cyclase [Nocardia sp. BMG111209]
MTLIEVERKRELPDSNSLRDRLAELGYRDIGCLNETDVYYSRPDVDFMETVECLRVRRRNGFAEVTYKPPSGADTHRVGDVIAKQETNVRLATPEQSDAARALLDALGMVELATVEKARTQYRHPERDNVVIAVDIVTGAGVFVETEITAGDRDAAIVDLERIEHELGIEGYPVVRLPYRDLVMATVRA